MRLWRAVLACARNIAMKRKAWLTCCAMQDQSSRAFCLAVVRKHIRPIAIEGFPAASAPAMLAALNEWPLAYRWSTRFVFMDAEEGKSALAKLRKKWRQK